MKMFALAIALAVTLLHAPVSAQQGVPFAGQRVATVMTWNVYHGVDTELGAVPTATSVPDLLQKVAAVYQGYVARSFHERAAAMAAEIDATRPVLIGLQEAVLVRTQSPPDGPATPATEVAFDYVRILLDALAERGLDYDLVVQAPNFDAELPSALGFDVRHTDREVILARADLKTADLKLSNAQGGTFATNCIVPSPAIGPVTLRRGWVAVDAKIRGKSFRFISTHLDLDCPTAPSVQQDQAAELLSGPAATDLPVVLVGDFNSASDGSGLTYNNLMAAGFTDAVAEAGFGGILSCCQSSDLLNAVSLLDRRVDHVLFRAGFTVLGADVMGSEAGDPTPSGLLWPSDHAGVAATLVLPHP